jgi:hypothetical protein
VRKNEKIITTITISDGCDDFQFVRVRVAGIIALKLVIAVLTVLSTILNSPIMQTHQGLSSGGGTTPPGCGRAGKT